MLMSFPFEKCHNSIPGYVNLKKFPHKDIVSYFPLLETYVILKNEHVYFMAEIYNFLHVH